MSGMMNAQVAGNTKSWYTHVQREQVQALYASACMGAITTLQLLGLPPLHLENCTTQQEESPCLEGVFDMAKSRQRVKIGEQPNGEPIYQWVQGNNQIELQNNMLLACVQSGYLASLMPAPPKQTTQTVKEYAEEWLNTYIAGKRKKNTVSTYKRYLRAHIYPALGHLCIAELDNNTKLAQSFFDGCKNRRTGKDLTKKTLEQVKNILSQVLDSAIEDELIAKNPCKSKRISLETKTESVPREAMDMQRFKAILHDIPNMESADERRLLTILMLTGCRRGEMLGLKWEDIDTEKKVLHIVRNVVHPDENQPTVTTPKTKSGMRTLPIDELFLSLIAPLGKSGYIFQMPDSDTGEPISEKRYNTLFNHIRERFGLGESTAHVLRHSYITYFAGEKPDLKSLQTVAGHKDITTTLNIYVHPQIENMRTTTDKVHLLLTQ